MFTYIVLLQIHARLRLFGSVRNATSRRQAVYQERGVRRNARREAPSFAAICIWDGRNMENVGFALSLWLTCVVGSSLFRLVQPKCLTIKSVDGLYE